MSGFELSGCAVRPNMYHASRWGRRRDSWVGIRWRRPFWSSPSSLSLATPQAQAQDLHWQVENPFRFFKSTRSFALHEAAYNAVRGNGELPRDVVWRTERRLNDPDCRDSSSPDRCAATAGKRYQQSRLGWAAQTLNDTCYDRNARPRRYIPSCERIYSWGKAREDYVLPEAHTVTIRIAAEKLEGVTGECNWTWRPRRDGGKVETKKQACKPTS